MNIYNRIFILTGIAVIAGLNASCDGSTESQLNELTTTICHVPQGEPNNPQTIKVSAAELSMHLADHPLDSFGSCDTNCKPGVCDDGVACTQDACLASGCSHTPVGCPVSECILALECDDGDECTADTCASNLCMHTVLSCDDNNACTTDSCSSIGGCSHLQKDCSSFDNQCNEGSCSNGVCGASPKPNGTLCDDSNPNTLGDKCTQGVCAGTVAPECTANSVCNDNNACTTDVCSSNKCTHNPLPGCCTVAADCNDNNLCSADLCVDGTCQYQLNCPLGTNCNPDNGQCEVVNPCPNTQCTGDQKLDPNTCTCVCDPLKCLGFGVCETTRCSETTQHCETVPVTCDDNDPCTTDFCKSSCDLSEPNCRFGCNNTPKCDDGDACTIDSCVVRVTGGGPRGTPRRLTGTCAPKELTNPGCCSEQTTCGGSMLCKKEYESDLTGLCVPELSMRECLNEASTGASRPVCPAGVPCDKGSICDDHNACTVDTCNNGACNHSLNLLCAAPQNTCGVVASCSSSGKCQLSPAQCRSDAQCCKDTSGVFKCLPCPPGGCISGADDPSCLP